MDLRLIYGWHLDGPSYPEQPAVGSVALGPVGLVMQLALRLGLTTVFPHMALRIATYSATLRALDDGSKFYSKSFDTDPWGTARALIDLRDELVAAGWDSSNKQPASNRLQTLADIENHSGSHIARYGDLLLPITRQLENGAKVPIKQVQLIDGQAALPPIYRRLIRAMSASGTEITDTAFPIPSGQSDVAKLARCLASLTKVECPLSGDGSLSLIESDDALQAADFTAELLRCSYTGDTVVIRGSDTSLLDRLLHKRGLPILGGASRSPLRGVVQLLPLTFELCWNPVDPMRILEFLTSPYSPIPNYVGDCFAFAIRGEPGVGGSAWSNAWKVALERKRTALVNAGNDPNEVEQSLIDCEKTWREWLEPSRFDPQLGIDAPHVVSTCKRLRQYALTMQAVRQNLIFAELAAYADTLAATVELSGLAAVPKAQLSRMIESVIGTGYKPDQPEASDWIVLDQPGQIFAPAGTVIWWGFNNNLSPPRPNPWTLAELASLSQQSVEIEKPAQAIAREAKSWRRPFVVGCERIILIKPRTVAGGAVAAHPFFHELSGALDSSPPAVRAKIVVQANQLYDQPELRVASLVLPRQHIQPISLPAPHRIISIPPASVPLRVESPSSIERLLGCPLNYLLRFTARIRPGNLISVVSGDRLAGNLAHAIFASLFSGLDSLSVENIVCRTELVFDEFCPKVAATLLLPGNSLERLRLKRSLAEAAAHLLALIHKAGFNRIECESPRQAQFQETELVGRTDMFLQFACPLPVHHSTNPPNPSDASSDGSSVEGTALPSSAASPMRQSSLSVLAGVGAESEQGRGPNVIIDLKWARRGVYKRREIEEGRAVQLAMYAWLCTQQTQQSTNAAYYMLSQKQLFSTSSQPFPQYTYVDGPGLDHTFSRVMESYLVHLRNLSEGTIYATGVQDTSIAQLQPVERYFDKVVHDDTTEALSPVPGVSLILEPPCRFCEYGRLCGKKELSS
ncbi:MAG TPA: PD-(D/E)XK nuclease family protein [Trichormus sp.]|jgi:hypothetical protein